MKEEILKNPKEENEKDLDSTIAELETRAQALREEIRKIEEESKLRETKPQGTSRRNFLKTLTLGGVGAMLLSRQTGVDDNPPTKEEKPTEPSLEEKSPKEIKKATEYEIEKCRKIIENERYEEIIENPFLVSALYYSEQAMKKLVPPFKYDTQEIIWSIYPLITKKFRENYIATLKRKTEGGGKNSNKKNPHAQPPPLNRISFGKNLRENHLDAIDLFTKEGSAIFSTSGGLVVLAENNWKDDDDMSTSSNYGGNTVIVFDPDSESFYRYAHMEESEVSAGKVLVGGEKIGVVGHTGVSASKPGHGEHLHFEINKYDRENGIMTPVSVFELKRILQRTRR